MIAQAHIDPAHPHATMEGHFVLCPCVWCRAKRDADARHRDEQRARRNGPCANHDLEWCYCDCGSNRY